MSDAQQNIGKLIEGEAFRDAIHIAILPAIAGEDIQPGDQLKFAYGSTEKVMRWSPYHENDRPEAYIGIADPFIYTGWEGIGTGQRFYMFVKPNTVTGMRHHWHLPAVDEAQPPTDDVDELWLRQYCEKHGYAYEDLLSAAQGEQEYVTSYGVDNHKSKPEPEVWEHLEGVLKKPIPQQIRESVHYSCSC
jgi:hypothetical protein